MEREFNTAADYLLPGLVLKICSDVNLKIHEEMNLPQVHNKLPEKLTRPSPNDGQETDEEPFIQDTYPQ